MKSVYVFGPITVHGRDYLPVYKRLMKICSKFFDRVIGTYPDFWGSKERPGEFYERTIRTISKCSLFIAEVSSPSHGVGMELQMGCENKIPIIALAKEGADVSAMVLGIPNLRKLIKYKNFGELARKLEAELKRFSE